MPVTLDSGETLAYRGWSVSSIGPKAFRRFLTIAELEANGLPMRLFQVVLDNPMDPRQRECMADDCEGKVNYLLRRITPEQLKHNPILASNILK